MRRTPHTRTLLILAVLAFATTPPHAAGKPVPPRGQLPPRDQRPAAQTGTAVIRGRVVAGDTGQPLRRARISLSAPELGRDNRSATTNMDGRYEIKDLPAGRYTLSVARSGYLPLKYGQRRPFEQGRPLQVADRQVVERVDFALPKMSVITGRVTDEFGVPIEGVTMLAMRSMYLKGRRQLVPVGTGRMQTDDVGAYRLTGLAPGTYVVMARSSDKWTVEEGGRETTMGYAPTYCPGVTRVADARKLTVGIGQEAGNIDFSLVPGRAATVSGMALDSRGRPFRNVGLQQEIRGLEFGFFSTAGSATVAADGTFTIPNVAPGDYKLAANSSDRAGEEPPEVAVIPIAVDGVDITNVTLTGSMGGSVSGRVLAEAGALPAASRIRITISEPVIGQTSPAMLGAFKNPGFGQVNEDGTFTVKNVFGPARFDVTVPDGWAVKGILHDGRDIIDVPIELKSGDELTGVQVILTDHLTSVTGQLTDDKGAPLTDGAVVVFSSDPARWFDASRFIKTARLDQQGQFLIKGLPPGEYLAIAVDYIEDGLWYDPDYLDTVRRYGQKLTLQEGGTETLSLKIAPST